MKIKNIVTACLCFVCIIYSFSQDVNTGKIKSEAWKTVKAINRSWAITKNLDSLQLLLHPDMVIILPDMKERLVGRNSIIESYKNYMGYAKTISLEEADPLIQLFNNNETAIVTYYYDLEIQTPDEQVYRYNGRDMYTLVKHNGSWIAVAQHLSPMPK